MAFALGAALAGVLGVVGVSVAFVRVTARGHLFTEADVPSTPVALVLGALVHPDGTPSSFLAGRLDLARRLYESGTVRVILVSGDGMAPEYNEPEAMRAYLVAAGVPPSHVVADDAGFDTYDSCVRARSVFGVREVIMVTQDYHLPRAVATCRAVGVRAWGVGDTTARRLRSAWLRGTLRDQLACVKTVWDLSVRRQPLLGPRQTGVEEALSEPS